MNIFLICSGEQSIAERMAMSLKEKHSDKELSHFITINYANNSPLNMIQPGLSPEVIKIDCHYQCLSHPLFNRVGYLSGRMSFDEASKSLVAVAAVSRFNIASIKDSLGSVGFNVKTGYLNHTQYSLGSDVLISSEGQILPHDSIFNITVTGDDFESMSRKFKSEVKAEFKIGITNEELIQRAFQSSNDYSPPKPSSIMGFDAVVKDTLAASRALKTTDLASDMSYFISSLILNFFEYETTQFTALPQYVQGELMEQAYFKNMITLAEYTMFRDKGILNSRGAIEKIRSTAEFLHGVELKLKSPLPVDSFASLMTDAYRLLNSDGVDPTLTIPMPSAFKASLHEHLRKFGTNSHRSYLDQLPEDFLGNMMGRFEFKPALADNEIKHSPFSGMAL